MLDVGASGRGRRRGVVEVALGSPAGALEGRQDDQPVGQGIRL